MQVAEGLWGCAKQVEAELSVWAPHLHLIPHLLREVVVVRTVSSQPASQGVPRCLADPLVECTPDGTAFRPQRHALELDPIRGDFLRQLLHGLEAKQ